MNRRGFCAVAGLGLMAPVFPPKLPVATSTSRFKEPEKGQVILHYWGLDDKTRGLGVRLTGNTVTDAKLLGYMLRSAIYAMVEDRGLPYPDLRWATHDEAAYQKAHDGPCPRCESRFIESSPNHPCGGFHRCNGCRLLWTTDGTIVAGLPLWEPLA